MAKVIDTHVHLGIRADMILPAETLMERMDQAGQDMVMAFPMVVNFEMNPPKYNPFSGNDYIAAAQQAYPERIIGLATVQPWYQHPRQMTKAHWEEIKHLKSYSLLLANLGQITEDWWKKDPTLDEVERAIIDLGLQGVKFHPLLQGFAINNSAIMDPICDRLTACSRKTGRRLLFLVHCMGDSVFGVPEQVGDLAERYPDLIFIIIHMGGIWTAQSGIRVTSKYENVLLDLTWVANEKNMREAIKVLGPQKIVAGSDEPFGSFEMKMAMMNRMFPEPQDRALVLGGNIQQILEI